MKKRFSEEQIIQILREAETTGTTVRELCRRHNVTEQTFFRWRNKYGGMEVSDAKRLRALEDENRRLKEMVADLSLDREVLKSVIRKNGWSL